MQVFHERRKEKGNVNRRSTLKSKVFIHPLRLTNGKVKTEKSKVFIHPLRFTNGKVKTEKSKVLSTPSASLVHPVSGGQSAGAVSV